MVRKIVQGIRSQKAIPIRKGIGFSEGVRYNSSTPGGLRSSPGDATAGAECQVNTVLVHSGFHPLRSSAPPVFNP